MERRVLLAIFLAFIVLYTWQALFVKPVPKPGSESAPVTSSAPAAVNPVGASGAPEAAAPSVAEKPAAPLAEALVADTAERDVRVVKRRAVRHESVHSMRCA